MSTTIFNTLASLPNTATLLQLIRVAGLTDLLNGQGPYTFFAPSNTALSSLSIPQLMTNLPRLRSILQSHIVAGRFTVADLLAKNGQTLTSLNGQPIKIGSANGQVMLNGTTAIVTPDIPASNGVVDVVNGVLMPSQAGTIGHPNLSWLWWLLLLILIIVVVYFIVTPRQNYLVI